MGRLAYTMLDSGHASRAKVLASTRRRVTCCRKNAIVSILDFPRQNCYFALRVAHAALYSALFYTARRGQLRLLSSELALESRQCLLVRHGYDAAVKDISKFSVVISVADSANRLHGAQATIP